MDINELERMMVKYGIAIRTIPLKQRHVLEKCHIGDYPKGHGKIQYLEEYGREMLVIETVPSHAGQFTFEFAKNTDSRVIFHGKAFFESLEELVDYFQEIERSEQLANETVKEDADMEME